MVLIRMLFIALAGWFVIQTQNTQLHFRALLASDESINVLIESLGQIIIITFRFGSTPIICPTPYKMPLLCEYCNKNNAVLKRPKTGSKICKPCFNYQFETEIHETIVANKLFSPGEIIAIGASGGKDSTVLARVLTKLNREYSYGLNLYLLSIDEGIVGYRDDSLEAVKRNQLEYQIPLKILSYRDLYGWTMDEIVAEIGKKNNCTFCGVFRRQALERGAMMINADKIVTGHNADDIAETVLMNILRGDISRLDRCVEIITDVSNNDSESIPRVKPFKYCYEKEIVMYAYYNELDYFSTECLYAPFAYRGFAREYLKELEKSDSKTIINIINSAESMRITTQRKATMNRISKCSQCGFISSNDICKACVLLEGLNKGRAKRVMGKTQKITVNKQDIQLEQNTVNTDDSAQNSVNTNSNNNNNINSPNHSNSSDTITSNTSTSPTPRVSAPLAIKQSQNSTDW